MGKARVPLVWWHHVYGLKRPCFGTSLFWSHFENAVYPKIANFVGMRVFRWRRRRIEMNFFPFSRPRR